MKTFGNNISRINKIKKVLNLTKNVKVSPLIPISFEKLMENSLDRDNIENKLKEIKEIIEVFSNNNNKYLEKYKEDYVDDSDDLNYLFFDDDINKIPQADDKGELGEPNADKNDSSYNSDNIIDDILYKGKKRKNRSKGKSKSTDKNNKKPKGRNDDKSKSRDKYKGKDKEKEGCKRKRKGKK